MAIYQELIERVDNGETFCIDFEKRNMKVGKEYLIKNGEYDVSREVFDMVQDEMQRRASLYSYSSTEYL